MSVSSIITPQRRREIAFEILGRDPANSVESDLCLRIFEAEQQVEKLAKEKMLGPNKIEALNPATGQVGNHHLISLATNPGLDKYMIVTFWVDGRVRTGWSSQMKMNDMAFGLMALDKKVRDVCVGQSQLVPQG